MNSGGLFIQWLQAYETDETAVRMVFATLRSVFRRVEVLAKCRQGPAPGLLGRTGGLPRRRVAAADCAEPFHTAFAKSWRAEDLEGVLSHFAGGDKVVEAEGRQFAALPNTDDHNRLEYRFARSLGSKIGFDAFQVRLWAISLHAEHPAIKDGEINWPWVMDAYREFLIWYGIRLPPETGSAPAIAARLCAWTVSCMRTLPEPSHNGNCSRKGHRR